MNPDGRRRLQRAFGIPLPLCRPLVTFDDANQNLQPCDVDPGTRFVRVTLLWNDVQTPLKETQLSGHRLCRDQHRHLLVQRTCQDARQAFRVVVLRHFFSVHSHESLGAYGKADDDTPPLPPPLR